MASHSKEEGTGCKAEQHEEPRSCEGSDNDTKGCPDCQRTIPRIKEAFNSEKYVLFMHVEYWVLGQSGKKGNINTVQKVRSFTNEFFRKVCSLRNSRGGVLAIHVLDMDENCGPSLDHFDEKVSKDLSNMIEDDSPYAYNYQRDWFQPTDDAEVPQDTKYIVVVVKGSSAVSTKCFNTLVPFDGSKERPRAREVAKFLCDDIKYGTSNEKGKSKTFKEGERVDLIESRSVQFKSFSPRDLENDCKDKPDLASKSLCERLVYRLIEKLDLLQYLTAFTKLSNGGSFYLGIEEEKKKVPGTTKTTCSRALDFNQDPLQLETDRESRVGRGRRSVSRSTKREADDRQEASRAKSSRSTKSEADDRQEQSRVKSSRSTKSEADDRQEQSRAKSSRSTKREADDRQEQSRAKSSRSTKSEADDRQKQSRTKSSTSEHLSRAGRDLERSRSRSRTTHERYSREHSSSRDSKSHKTSRRRSRERDSGDRYRDRRGRSPSRRQRYDTPPPLKMPRRESERRGRSSHRSLPHSPISPRRPEMSRQSSTVSVKSSSSVPGTSAPTRIPGTLGVAGHKEIKTGYNVVRGFVISESEKSEMEKLIMNRISENMMWMKRNGDCINVSNISDAVDIIFHECTSGGDSKYVLEIRVKQVFRGLVFFTKEGPEAYRLGANGQTVSIPISEWTKLLKRAAKCASCVHGPIQEPRDDE